MRDLLAGDVQSETQLALYSLSELNEVDTDEARAEILKDAFSSIGFALRNSRYDFFETYLVQETPDGQLLLRGRYPSKAAIEGVSVANTPLFDHVDLAAVEVFASSNEIYQVEESALLGGNLIGRWPTEGYEFDLSLALDGDEFLGLGLDNDNEEELTEERLIIWAELIRDEFVA